MRIFLTTILSLVSFATIAIAGELPKSARPQSAEEVKSLYSGKTTLWSKHNSAFFAADGTVKGVYKGGYFDGKWDVVENEICMRAQGTDSKTKKSDGKTYTDCWKWFRDAKERVWTIWSVHYDGSKPTKKDYNTDEIRKLKDGDLVTDRYEKAKSS